LTHVHLSSSSSQYGVVGSVVGVYVVGVYVVGVYVVGVYVVGVYVVGEQHQSVSVVCLSSHWYGHEVLSQVLVRVMIQSDPHSDHSDQESGPVHGVVHSGDTQVSGALHHSGIPSTPGGYWTMETGLSHGPSHV